jgi:hypothetical protein
MKKQLSSSVLKQMEDRLTRLSKEEVLKRSVLTYVKFKQFFYFV